MKNILLLTVQDARNAIKERNDNFKEVELGFTEEQAINEAKRCLECGCQVNETCALREYASDYLIEHIILSGDQNRHPIDDSHPFIRRDNNKCINCGRCIRICSEVQGAGVLGYIYRGFTTLVAPEYNESLTQTSCESCGKCIAVCPTGALTEKHTERKISHLTGDITYQNCASCGLGCKIKVDSSNQTIRVISHPDVEHEGFNGRNICFYGRYGWQIYYQEDRICKPMQKRDGKWHEISLKEVKEILTQQLMLHKNKHFYITPELTIDELLIAKTIEATKKATVSTLYNYQDFTDKLINTNFRDLNIYRLNQAHSIIIIGEITHTLRTLCRTAQRQGAKLILVNPRQSNFNQFADEISESLASIKSDLTTKTIFVYNRNCLTEKEIYEIWKKATEVCDFEGPSGIIVNSYWDNQSGLALFDFKQGLAQKDSLNFYWNTDIDEAGESYNVCLSSYFDFNNAYDLYIPTPSYLETEGYALTDEGRISQFNNPTKSSLFYFLLNIFYETNIIHPSQAEPSLWNNKAEVLLKNRIVEDKPKHWLIDYLDTVIPSDKRQDTRDVRKKKIKELFGKAKKKGN